MCKLSDSADGGDDDDVCVCVCVCVKIPKTGDTNCVRVPSQDKPCTPNVPSMGADWSGNVTAAGSTRRGNGLESTGTCRLEVTDGTDMVEGRPRRTKAYNESVSIKVNTQCSGAGTGWAG